MAFDYQEASKYYSPEEIDSYLASKQKGTFSGSINSLSNLGRKAADVMGLAGYAPTMRATKILGGKAVMPLASILGGAGRASQYLLKDITGQGNVPRPAPLNQSLPLSEKLGQTAQYGGQLLGGLGKAAGQGALEGLLAGYPLGQLKYALAGAIPGLGKMLGGSFAQQRVNLVNQNEESPIKQKLQIPMETVRSDISKGTSLKGYTAQPYIKEYTSNLPKEEGFLTEKGAMKALDAAESRGQYGKSGVGTSGDKAVVDTARYFTKVMRGYIDKMDPQGVSTLLKKESLIKSGEATRKWAVVLAGTVAGAAFLRDLIYRATKK